MSGEDPPGEAKADPPGEEILDPPATDVVVVEEKSPDNPQEDTIPAVDELGDQQQQEDDSNNQQTAAAPVASSHELEGDSKEPEAEDDVRVVQEGGNSDDGVDNTSATELIDATAESSKSSKGSPEESMEEEEEEKEEVFVNRGFALWEKSRHQWLGDRSDTEGSTPLAAIPLDVDDIIDVIFASTRQVRELGGPKFFPKPVPLPQMIDILVDLW
jgi:hypothetical protein